MRGADLFSPEILLMASVAVVSGLAWAVPSVRAALILEPWRVREKGHVHRLLTAGWIHGDGTHLLLNLLTLHAFAHKPLAVLGPVAFVALYVSAVIVGFLPTTLRYMKNRRYASLGASGAVSAVMFSSILLYPTGRLALLFIPVPVPAPVFGVAYLAYCAWHSWRSRDGINHDAHFSGAIYGAAFTYLLARAEVTRAMAAVF